MEIEDTEALCDIKIDYTDVVVSIQQGMVSESDATPYRFSETVSFGTFSTLSASTTVSGAAELLSSAIVSLACLLALKIF